MVLSISTLWWGRRWRSQLCPKWFVKDHLWCDKIPPAVTPSSPSSPSASHPSKTPTPAHTGLSLVSISALISLCKPCCSLTRDHLWELRLNEIITPTIRLTFQTLCSPSINGSSGCILDFADYHLEEFTLHCEALSDHVFIHLCSFSQNNAHLIGIQLICPLFFFTEGLGHRDPPESRCLWSVSNYLTSSSLQCFCPCLWPLLSSWTGDGKDQSLSFCC